MKRNRTSLFGKIFALSLVSVVSLGWGCGSASSAPPLSSAAPEGHSTTPEAHSGTPAPAGAKGSHPEAYAKDFKTSCSKNDDCVAIWEGDLCSPCQCANAAIAKSELPKYNAKREANASCRQEQKCLADCIAVSGAPALCVAGTCKYEDRKP